MMLAEWLVETQTRERDAYRKRSADLEEHDAKRQRGMRYLSSAQREIADVAEPRLARVQLFRQLRAPLHLLAHSPLDRRRDRLRVLGLERRGARLRRIPGAAQLLQTASQRRFAAIATTATFAGVFSKSISIRPLFAARSQRSVWSMSTFLGMRERIMSGRFISSVPKP